MGPVAPTLTSGLHDVAPALDTSTFEGGPRAPLGQCVPLAPSASDTTLCYIRPLGHANEGDVVFGPHADKRTVEAEIAAGTLERVFLPANHGGQVWMYIRAGEDLKRGEGIALDLTVTDEGVYEFIKSAVNAAGGGSNITKAVVQWNIDDQETGWALVSGEGVILSAAAIAAEGDNLDILTTAGRGDTQATAGLASYARALATAAGAGEWTPADIHCPG